MKTATTLYEILCHTSPPRAVIELLQREERLGRLGPDVVTWLRRWERLRTGDPVPEVDRWEGGRYAIQTD